MPQDAYVILKGGVFTRVEGFDIVEEIERDKYCTGETYRDLFGTKAASGDTTVAAGGAYFPAADGQAFNTAYGAQQAMKARLSDEISHTPPRHLETKHTRLRFYKKSAGQIEWVHAASNSLQTTAGPVPSPRDMVSFRVEENGQQLADLAGITGLVAGEIYFVRSVSGEKFSVSTTRDGAEVDISFPDVELSDGQLLLFDCLLCIADFKPGEWKGWSNGVPQRF